MEWLWIILKILAVWFLLAILVSRIFVLLVQMNKTLEEKEFFYQIEKNNIKKTKGLV